MAASSDSAPRGLLRALPLVGILGGLTLGVVVIVQALSDDPTSAPPPPPDLGERPAAEGRDASLRQLPRTQEEATLPAATARAPDPPPPEDPLRALRETPLRDLEVPGLAFEDAPARTILEYIARAAGRRLEVHETARAKVDGLRLNLSRLRTPVTELLDLALERFGLVWRERGDAIEILLGETPPVVEPRVPRIR